MKDRSTLTADSLIQDLQTDIAYYDERITGAKSMLVSHGWVITSSDIPIQLHTDNAGNVIGVSVVGWLGQYSRLTREDAQNIAPTIHNGNGEQAQAMPYVVALERARQNSVSALEWVREQMTKNT